MAQYVKLEGVITKPVGRPILNAGSSEASLILDARRYVDEFKNRVVYDQVKAIGTLSSKSLIMNKSSSVSDASGFMYEIEDGVPSFRFNSKQSLHTSMPILNIPITVVCVYRIDAGSWPDSRPSSRLYSLGSNPENALKLAPFSNKLLVQANTSDGIGYEYDASHVDWAVSVIKFNGKSSRIITRNGDMLNVELTKTAIGPGSASLFGNSTSPQLTEGSIRYFAIYDEDMTDSELMSLHYDAKNSFQLP